MSFLDPTSNHYFVPCKKLAKILLKGFQRELTIFFLTELAYKIACCNAAAKTYL